MWTWQLVAGDALIFTGGLLFGWALRGSGLRDRFAYARSCRRRGVTPYGFGRWRWWHWKVVLGR
jgi:hypothetical protein